MTSAIEMKDLYYRPGRDFAVEGLSLNVPEGSIYGFLGPNGAGKTTTIRLMLGLLHAKKGTIRVMGETIPDRAPAALARIGYVPERPHLHRFFTVQESIRFHASFHKRWDHKWASQLISEFGLPRDRPLAQLSKGEMGKLMVLQALCSRPELLVLDEPTDGLDPVVRRDVLRAVVDYVSEHRATVFISSHLVYELERLCDWVGMMDGGKLVAEMPMEELKAGIKRLRIRGPVDRLQETPFAVLSRNGHENGTGAGSTAVWVVDRWRPDMSSWIGERGVTIEAVDDLDLEEGFVERLRARRAVGS